MITLLVFQDTEPVPHGFPEDNTIPEQRLHKVEVTILSNEILRFLGFLHARVGRGTVDDDSLPPARY